jgi:A/G-specific adenine glycosylase
MDYGTYLKKEYKNPSRKSAHHTKQSRFEGSHRQVRGAVLRFILQGEKHSIETLGATLPFEKRRIQSALDGLFSEGLIKMSGEHYHC